MVKVATDNIVFDWVQAVEFLFKVFGDSAGPLAISCNPFIGAVCCLASETDDHRFGRDPLRLTLHDRGLVPRG